MTAIAAHEPTTFIVDEATELVYLPVGIMHVRFEPGMKITDPYHVAVAREHGIVLRDAAGIELDKLVSRFDHATLFEAAVALEMAAGRLNDRAIATNLLSLAAVLSSRKAKPAGECAA